MKNLELPINFAGISTKIFIQGGFFFDSPSNTIHRHKHTEVRCIISGECDVFADGKNYTLTAGEFIAIPSGAFHCHNIKSPDTKHFAFQVNYKIDKCILNKISSGSMNDIANEIEKFKASENGRLISSYISLICSFISNEDNIKTSDITDRDFLIDEFFSINYNKDISLSDLSETLNLSEKQTERLVFCHTGNTFREEIQKRRMEAAKQLIDTKSMNLTQIAEYVGYKTYVGFWKAYKSYYSPKK